MASAWLALGLFFASSAAAATFDVDRTGDGFLAGGCTSAPNDCTLRDAVANANSGPGNTVSIPAGTYRLTIGGSDDADAMGDLDFIGSTTVTGAGAGVTTFQAVGIDRVLDFRAGTSSLSGVTVTGGGTDDGAGINVHAGTLSVADSVITGNTIVSPANGGGGILVEAGSVLNLDRTTVSNNDSGTGNGGGMNNAAGTVTITNSTISNNHTHAPGDGGGGVYNQGTLTLINSTVSGNTALDSGGGIDDVGATIINSTIAGNSAGSNGGGVQVASGTSHIENSIFAQNSAPSGANCAVGFGMIASQGHNIDSGSTCAFAAGGDLPNTDPLLGPLADNGGPTQTRALAFGSQAINAGDGAACAATDQRGLSRQGTCDIGAYEFVDSDGDGVPDEADACPAVAAQTANGCPPPDTTPPVLNLGGRKLQKEDGTIEVKVSCDEACLAIGGGTLTVTRPARATASAATAAVRRKFTLKPNGLVLGAGQTGVLKLKLPKRGNRAALAALRSGGHSKARITVSATDAGRNSATGTRGVRFKPVH